MAKYQIWDGDTLVSSHSDLIRAMYRATDTRVSETMEIWTRIPKRCCPATSGGGSLMQEVKQMEITRLIVRRYMQGSWQQMQREHLDYLQHLDGGW